MILLGSGVTLTSSSLACLFGKDELSLTVSNSCILEYTDMSHSFCNGFELNLHVVSLLYCHDSFKKSF